MHVRKATETDADILAELSLDVLRMHAEAYPHMFKQPKDSAESLAFMQKQLADPDVTLLLLNIDDQDVGYAYVRVAEREENPFVYGHKFLSLHHISLRPEARGKGGGAALISAVKELAATLGLSRIDLETWSFNTHAHGFFQDQGFEMFSHRMWHFVESGS